MGKNKQNSNYAIYIYIYIYILCRIKTVFGENKDGEIHADDLLRQLRIGQILSVNVINNHI